MVKALVVLLLLCVLSGPTCAQNAALPTSLAAQEAGGTIWGAVADAEEEIFRWTGGHWQLQAMPEAKGFVPQAITRGDDGAVYMLWHPHQTDANVPSQVLLVTVSRGVGSRVLARFSAPLLTNTPNNSVPALWAGVGGDVWVADSQATLWHVNPDGQATPFPLKANQVRGEQGQMGGFFQPVWTRSLVDGQGRRWFWQDGLQWNARILRGALIWDGRRMSYYATLPGLPDHPFSTLERQDSRHLWAALGPDWTPNHPRTMGGLYRLDTLALTASSVSGPDQGAYGGITQILHAGDDWYAYVRSQGTGLPTALWRQRRGVWQKCLAEADHPYGAFNSDLRQPWLATPAGLWLGVSEGAWFVPAHEGSPVRVDWRRGLNLSSVTHFFRVPGGLLATGTGAGVTARLPASPPPILPLPLGLMAESGGLRSGLWSLIADPRRHLWGMDTDWSHGFLLDEWDGDHWRFHAAPKSTPQVANLLASDTRGRIWLITRIWTPPAAPTDGITIYDPAENSWTCYDSGADALKASAALPGVALMPSENVVVQVALSGDGRAAYTDQDTISLYDGRDWRHWKAGEIETGYGYEGAGGTPELIRDGPLRVRLNGGPWDWTAERGWQKAVEAASQPLPSLPPGGPPGFQGWWNPSPSLPSDEDGACWVNSAWGVYKTWHGLWANPPFLSAPGSPFRDGRRIQSILTDPKGRLFFLTVPTNLYEIVAWLPPTAAGPSAPRLRIMPLAADSVALHFSTTTKGGHWFLWRLNGGEWSAPQRAGSVTLSDLAHGDYRVEAQTMDALLQASAHPSVAAFTIRASTPSQVARWVQTLLTGSDDAREAAARGLAKQPDLALPDLRAARPGASESGRWWIDAVLQQIGQGDASP